MLPLDVMNTRLGSNIDMYHFWNIIWMTSLFMCTLVLPFMLFFYATYEDLDFKSRFCTAFSYEITILVLFSIVHFSMFAGMRKADIPLDSYAWDIMDVAEPIDEFAVDPMALIF